MKKLTLLIFLFSSCASLRPGPMVKHPVIKDNKTKAQDIVTCEKESKGSKDTQQKCLAKKGYSVLGWN